MFPYHDENETQHTALVTLGLIGLNVAVWLFVQGRRDGRGPRPIHLQSGPDSR